MVEKNYMETEKEKASKNIIWYEFLGVKVS